MSKKNTAGTEYVVKATENVRKLNEMAEEMTDGFRILDKGTQALAKAFEKIGMVRAPDLIPSSIRIRGEWTLSGWEFIPKYTVEVMGTPIDDAQGEGEALLESESFPTPTMAAAWADSWGPLPSTEIIPDHARFQSVKAFQRLLS